MYTAMYKYENTLFWSLGFFLFCHKYKRFTFSFFKAVDIFAAAFWKIVHHTSC